MNLKLIDDVLRQVAAEGVKSAELTQSVNKATAAAIMQSERPSNRLFGLGGRWLTCGEYISTDETLARLRELTVDSVSQAAAKYLVEPPVEIVAAADAAAIERP